VGHFGGKVGKHQAIDAQNAHHTAPQDRHQADNRLGNGQRRLKRGN